MKKNILKLLLLVVLVAGVINCSNYAKAETNEQFAATLKVKKNASTEQIQKVLDKAAKKAKGKKRVMVTIPAGTYKVTKTLQIGSNTYLKCDKKAKFIKKSKKVLYMLRSAKGKKKGYNNVKNITVEGGVWDAKFLKFNKESGGSLFFFVHGQNIQFYNLTLKNNYGTHLLELGGVKDVTISGCTFYGFKMSANKDEKEAIQLDICHNYDVLPDGQPYDDTACQNVIIENNEIYNYPRAIGSHTAVKDVYPTNIIIRNNNFHDLSENAVYAYNYRNLTVDSNTFDNVASGVVFKTFATEAKQTLYKRNKGVKATKFADRNFNINITNNTIKTTNTSIGKNTAQYGIFVYGTEEYMIKGCTVTDNKINSASSGMYYRYVDDSTITRNVCNRRNNSTNGKFLVDCYKFLSCSNITVSENVVGNDGGNLYENGFAFRDSSKNNVLANNELKQVSKHGIVMYTNSSISVNNNIVNSVGQNGIGVYDKSQATIMGNTVKSAGQHGVTAVENSSAVLQNNNISNCSGNGITFVGSSSSGVTDNMVSNSGGSGISVQGSSDIASISNNKLFGNIAKSIAINDSSVPTVSGNVMYSGTAEFELTAVAATTPVTSFRPHTASDISSASTAITGTCHTGTKVYAVINDVTYEAQINKKDYTITIPVQAAGTMVEIYQEDSVGNKVKISKMVQ